MKIKIILTNLVVVLLIGFASHVYLKSSLKSNFNRDEEATLTADRGVFKDLIMLQGFQLMAEVQRKASSPEARAVFDPLPPDEKQAEKDLRARSFIMVDKYAAEELSIDPEFGRKPELVAITNPKGIVIARDTDANANVGEMWGNQYNLVKFALNGRSKWDIIEYQGMFLQAAVAPIVRDEGIVGCLLVGFEVDNGFMAKESGRLGSEIGIIIKDKIYASSFTDELKRKSLADTLSTEEKSRLNQALEQNRPSDIFKIKILEEPFIASISPIPGNYQVGKAGFAVLRSLDRAYSPLRHLWFIVAFTGLGALLVILIGILLGAHFIKPIEALESEVRKVLEGDYEHRWEIKSSEVGGLSYLINQMLDALTGEEEETEGEEKKEAPRERAQTEEEFMREGESHAVSIEEIMAEPLDQYYKRIYKEFRDAKTKIGEDPDSISFEQFTEKLKETEQNILSKQQGRSVRFQVQIQGNKISYKPVIIP
jgi:hypothetical protein